MEEPAKPFACSVQDCGMSFTNEDHLHVHTKKHDMVLQFGLEQKSAFVADQTPTPTRFIRNCEEVGLFQDLQNVNPFDEGFKRAMDAKNSLCLEGGSSDDTLHTPHFPLLDPGDTLYSTTNNQKNITISRSSSDESGAIKEYETTTISKLTNEVTTISRLVGKQTDTDKLTEEKQPEKRDIVNETSISYTNNVIIHSNVEIRKDSTDNLSPVTLISVKNRIQNKDTSEQNKITQLKQEIIDSIDLTEDKKQKKITNNKIRMKADGNFKMEGDLDKEDYEVTIKLPNGKHVKMKPVEEVQNETKTKLKKALEKKQRTPLIQTLPVSNQIVQNILPIAPGTLIPVTLVSSMANSILPHNTPKIPIVPFNALKIDTPKPVKRKSTEEPTQINNGTDDKEAKKRFGQSKSDLESRSAASRRYRARRKETERRQADEIRKLSESNQRLVAEKNWLQTVIKEHLKTCPLADDLKKLQEKLANQSRTSYSTIVFEDVDSK